MIHLLAALVQDLTTVPSLGQLLTHWQMSLVVVLSSGAFFGLTRLVPRVAQWENWVKRLLLIVVAVGISAVVRSVGGTVSPDLAGLFWTAADGLASAVTANAVFQIGKTQPGNTGDGGAS